MDDSLHRKLDRILSQLEDINKHAQSSGNSEIQEWVKDTARAGLESALTGWIPRLQSWADLLEREPMSESTIDLLEETPVSEGLTIRQALMRHCYLLKGLIKIVKPPTALERFTETLTTIIGTLGNVRSTHHFVNTAASDGTLYQSYVGSDWTFDSTALPQFAMVIRDLMSKVEDILAETKGE